MAPPAGGGSTGGPTQVTHSGLVRLGPWVKPRQPGSHLHVKTPGLAPGLRLPFGQGELLLTRNRSL